MAAHEIKADDTLNKINETFRIVDISNRIVTATNEENAKQIHETRNFDRVPIKNENGNIEEYYDSNATGNNNIIKINTSDIISESTGILETLTHISEEGFYFVSTDNKITHIVHYSDLNNPIVLPGIYTLIAYCEIGIRKYLKCKNICGNTESEIIKFLLDMNDKIQHLNVKKDKKLKIVCAVNKFTSDKRKGIETNVLDDLYFYDELILFRELNSMLNDDRAIKFKESVNLEADNIILFRNLRNNIMHSNYQIVKKKNQDIEELATFIKTCQKIVSYTERISE